MKTHLLALLLLILCPLSTASELGISKVYLPLYIANAFFNNDANPVHAQPIPTNILSRGSYPETTLAVLNGSFIPHHDVTWHEKPKDTNLITLCGIKLTHVYLPKKPDQNVRTLQIIMHMKNYNKPSAIRMTDDQVKKLIQQAIAKNFPKSVIVMKSGEDE